MPLPKGYTLDKPSTSSLPQGYTLDAPDFSAPDDNKEGLYEMKGKDGKVQKVPYGKVEEAFKTGLRFDNPAGFRNYTNDKAADQPSALSQLTSNFGSALRGAAQGVASVFNPKPNEYEKAHGMTTVYDAALSPLERIVEPQAQQAEQAGDDARKAGAGAVLRGVAGLPFGILPDSPEASTAIGHGLAAVTPGVGPWMAQVGEQVGGQLGTGDYAGAAGTVAGNAAVAAAPKVVGKVAGLVPKAIRGTVEAVTKTTPAELKRLAEETRKTNEAAAEKSKQDYLDATAKHQVESESAAHETRGKELKAKAENTAAKVEALKKEKAAEAKHNADVETVRKHNDSVLRDRKKRADTQEKLDTSSAELEKKYDDAEVKANKDNDAAWDEVREKVKDAQTEVEPIKNVVKVAATMADPTSSPIFKSILNEGEGEVKFDDEGRPIVGGQTRNVTVSGKEVPVTDRNYPFYYETLYGEPPPIEDAAGTTNFGRLQRWYTYLNDRLYSGGRIEAGTYNALKMTRDAVNNAMGKIAEETGATKDLEKARKLHTEKMETFHDSPSEPATVASKSLQETTPEYTKQQKIMDRRDKVAKYDPSISQLAEHVENLQSGLKALPKEAPLRDQIQHYPAAPAPVTAPKLSFPERNLGPDRPTDEPPKQETITPEIYQEKKTGNVKNRAELIRELGVRRVFNNIFYTLPAIAGGTLAAAFTGHPNIAFGEALALPIIVASAKTLSGLLENKAVVESLSKITDKDLKAMDELSPQDKAVFSQNFRNLATAAKAKGAKLSPALSAFIGGAAASQSKSPSEVKKQAEEKQNPPSGGDAKVSKSASPSELIQRAKELHSGFQNSGMAPV